jgi:two-component system sporulation sensor kinase B
LNAWKQKWKELFPYILLTFTLLFFALGTQFLDDYKFTSQEFILWIWFSIFNYLTLWMVMFIQNTIIEMDTVSEKLIQFEKSHTVNQLLVSISCQLVVPLKRAKEQVHSIQDEILSSRQTDSLKRIEEDLTQAEQSLNQYLSIMENNHEKKGTWNFVEELEGIIQLMKLYAKMHQVEMIYTSTAEEELAIKGEHSMIRFALINIIKNAIEACKPRGQVNIYLHDMLQEVYIVIEDNGVGIPTELLTKIDKPLPSFKENGTGLGLASTFKIAESLGGRVEVESKPNEGTTFSLYFPKWAL